jgi:LacI family transcriptional regulator
MPKFLKTIPHVLVVLTSVQKAQQDKIQGILKYARLNGPWDVQLLEDRPYISKLGMLKNWHPDGIITRGSADTFEGQPADTEKTPTVFIDAVSSVSQPHSVNQNPRLISETVADYYLRQGLRQFAYVSSIPQSCWSLNRANAFVDRLRQNGCACAIYEPEHMDDWGLEQRHMLKWLISLPRPCGVMAALDLQAKQVLDTCLKAGIRVPEEIAVIGVDDDETICENTLPTLSSVLPDFEGGGYLAAELLDRLMRGSRRKSVSLTYGVKRIVHRQSSQYIQAPTLLAASAVEFIRLNACAGITVPDVARNCHVSRSVIEKAFKHALGHSLLEEIQNRRLERLCMLLRETTLPIGEIGERCGYSTETYLKRLFKRTFGLTMRDYRKRPIGRGEADPERIGHIPPGPPRVEPQTGVESNKQTLRQKGVESKTARAVLSLLAQGSHGKAEIARALGKPKPGRYLNERVVKLLRQHLIERTLPDKPNSRLQRYRLTPLGHTILAALNKK